MSVHWIWIFCFYGDQIIQNERLTVPHYDMKNREFVIVPLNDIAQDLVLPEGEKVANFGESL